jgi:hypothetical protein
MISSVKVPFGTAKMVRVTGAKYLAWEDAFEVDFEDGLRCSPVARTRGFARTEIEKAIRG